MDPNELTIEQLKNILRRNHLPIAGRKAELILRMQESDPTGRWIAEASDVNDPNETRAPMEEDIPDISAEIESRGFEQREAELLRRERDLMEREIELLQRENTMLRSSNVSQASGGSSRSTVGVRGICELLSEYH